MFLKNIKIKKTLSHGLHGPALQPHTCLCLTHAGLLASRRAGHAPLGTRRHPEGAHAHVHLAAPGRRQLGGTPPRGRWTPRRYFRCACAPPRRRAPTNNWRSQPSRSAIGDPASGGARGREEGRRRRAGASLLSSSTRQQQPTQQKSATPTAPRGAFFFPTDPFDSATRRLLLSPIPSLPRARRRGGPASERDRRPFPALGVARPGSR